MEDGGAILGPVLLIDPSLNIIPMKKVTKRCLLRNSLAVHKWRRRSRFCKCTYRAAAAAKGPRLLLGFKVSRRPARQTTGVLSAKMKEFCAMSPPCNNCFTAPADTAIPCMYD